VPRKGHIQKRDVLADPLYDNKVVTKLINNIMLDGKKGVAQKITYGAFDIIKERTNEEPLEVFRKALANVMPTLECKARRVGGANYQIPMDVKPERRQTLVLRWIVQYSRNRSERTSTSKPCTAEASKAMPASVVLEITKRISGCSASLRYSSNWV